jgi:predicted unusual protein kinase regulating ubiquinone biosynthesis (AarF/ABC1/UbiB family)
MAEGRFLQRFAALIADEPDLLVPRVHWDCTTSRVMAMDYIDGVPLESLAGGETPQAQRDKLGALLERLLFRELFEFRVMQTDPNFGNYLFQPKTGRLVLLDFGSTMEFSAEFVGRYRRISRAVIERDREAVAREAVAIGYIDANEPAQRVDAVVDVILLVCEPLQHRGRYDFGASDLPQRARDLGLDLIFKQRLLRAPPPETMFLSRKLVGLFLLVARLGARVDVQALIRPFLTEPRNAR